MVDEDKDEDEDDYSVVEHQLMDWRAEGVSDIDIEQSAIAKASQLNSFSICC